MPFWRRSFTRTIVLSGTYVAICAALAAAAMGQVPAGTITDYWPSPNIEGHFAPIRAVTFSHDSKYCCTAGGHVVQVWRLPAGAAAPASHHATLRWEAGPAVWGDIYSLAVKRGAEGEPLVALGGHSWRGEEGLIAWFEIGDEKRPKDKRGIQRGVFRRPDDTPYSEADPFASLNAIACSPDGKHLASLCYRGLVKVWDCDRSLTSHTPRDQPRLQRQGPHLDFGRRDTPYRIAVSDRYLAASRRSGSGWSIELHELGGKAAPATVLKTAGQSWSLAISADRRVAAGSDDGKIYVWELPGGGLPAELPQDGAVAVSLCFDAAGETLAAGYKLPSGGGRVVVWKRTAEGWTSAFATKAEEVAAPVVACAISPDGQFLAYTRDLYDVQLRRLKDFAALPPIRTGQPATRNVAFDAEGHGVTYEWDGAPWRFNPAPLDPKRGLDARKNPILASAPAAANATALRVVEEAGQVWLWDASTGSYLGGRAWKRAGHDLPLCACKVPGKPLVAVVGRGDPSRIHVFRADRPDAPAVRSFRGHESAVTSLAAHGDGRFLVSSSVDGTIRYWSLDNWDSDNVGAQRWGVELFNAGGKLVAGAIDPSGPFAVWGVRRGDAIQIEVVHSDGSKRRQTDAGEVYNSLRELPFATFVIAGRDVLGFAIPADWSYVVSIRPHRKADSKVPDWIAWTPKGQFASDTPDGENLLGWLAIHNAPEKQPLYLLAASMGKDRYDRSIIGQLFPDVSKPPSIPPVEPPPKEKERPRPALSLSLPRELPPERPALLGQAAVKADRAALRWQVGPSGVSLDEMFLLVTDTKSNSFKTVPVEFKKGQVTFSHELALTPGIYDVQVAVRWRGILFESEDSWSIAVAGQRPKTPKMYVYGIGCANYLNPGLFGLPDAAEEIHKITSVLKEGSSGLFDSSDFHKEPRPSETWKDIAWNRDEIVARLRELGNKLSVSTNPEDVGVLLLSGHGTEVDGRYYFIPSDGKVGDKTTWIPGDEILQYVVPSDKSSAMPRVVVVLDTCFSGKFLGVAEFDKTLRDQRTRKSITIVSAALRAAPGESDLARQLIKTLSEGRSRDGDFVTRDDVVRDAQNVSAQIQTFTVPNTDFAVARVTRK